MLFLTLYKFIRGGHCDLKLSQVVKTAVAYSNVHYTSMYNT